MTNEQEKQRWIDNDGMKGEAKVAAMASAKPNAQTRLSHFFPKPARWSDWRVSA